MRILIAILFTLGCVPATAQKVSISEGSGNFVIDGGAGRENKSLTIYYHKPVALTSNSPVLIVIPGAGRNAWSYRDAWVEASEEHDVLVLSPHYSDDDYPEFWSYNLAGMLENVVINSDRTRIVGFDINRNSQDWIFADFDRIFDIAKDQLGLLTDTYDMFGHSAGGQVLHRLALFHPNSNANRLVAANSGWYTVATFVDEFPYGLNGIFNEHELTSSFTTKLIVFLGELDDRNETRGDLVRSPEVDVQGLSRIERGNYFYQKAAETARNLNIEFNWQLHVVPEVGHDFRQMTNAAASYLY